MSQPNWKLWEKMEKELRLLPVEKVRAKWDIYEKMCKGGEIEHEQKKKESDANNTERENIK